MLASILLFSAIATVAPPTGEALKAEVLQLVRKLDSDERPERDAAETRLLELGPAAIEFLPAPESQPNENLAESVRRIRRRLENARAVGGFEASTVTLHGPMRLSKILAEIERQTGNAVSRPPLTADGERGDPELQVDFDKAPFWTALDRVLDEARLSIYPYGEPGKLRIVARAPHELPRSGRAAVVGPLRIEPVTVLAQRELRSSSAPSLRVSLEVAWEPRLQPIAVKQRMADLKALDSRNKNIAVQDPEAEKEAVPRGGSSAVQMDLALDLPAAGEKEIASLTGTVRAMVLGPIEEFRFDGLLKGKQEKRIAAAKVMVDDFRKNGETWEIFVRLRYDDAGDALESHRNWALENRAYLEDADGKRIEPDSMETTLRTKNEIGVGYVFALDKSPEKMIFVYRTPGMIVTKGYPYEVRGVKLP